MENALGQKLLKNAINNPNLLKKILKKNYLMNYYQNMI